VTPRLVDTDVGMDSRAHRIEKELTALVEATHDRVYAVAYAVTGNSAAADDVVQDTYLTAWRKWDELDRSRDLGPWLCQTARFLALNAGRRRRSGPVLMAELPEAADQQSPLDVFAAHQLAAELDRCWDQLTDADREALALYYRVESHERVAEHLDISVPAARKRVSRARQSLRADADAFLRGDSRRGRTAAATIAAIVACFTGAGGASAAEASAASSEGTTSAVAVAGSTVFRWLVASCAAVVLIVGGALMWTMIGEARAERAIAAEHSPRSAAADRPVRLEVALPALDQAAPEGEPDAFEGLADQPLITGTILQRHPEADTNGDGRLDEDEVEAFADSSDERIARLWLLLRERGLEQYMVRCRGLGLDGEGIYDRSEHYPAANGVEVPDGLTVEEAVFSWIATSKGSDDRVCGELSVAILNDNGQFSDSYTVRIVGNLLRLDPVWSQTAIARLEAARAVPLDELPFDDPEGYLDELEAAADRERRLSDALVGKQ
ncbi:MAG: sigma-70 family RNA polymerase sigma factor, partial [Deltaproteobacteria bacterium]|nr:sigma-70 family RNA polymerase sigma factor [Deltaproteobacteria bacterium]